MLIRKDPQREHRDLGYLTSWVIGHVFCRMPKSVHHFIRSKSENSVMSRGGPACLLPGMIQKFPPLILHCPGRSGSLCLFPECQGWMMPYLQPVSFQAQPPSGRNSSCLYKCFVSYNWILLKYAWHLYIVVGILNMQTNPMQQFEDNRESQSSIDKNKQDLSTFSPYLLSRKNLRFCSHWLQVYVYSK